MGWFDSKMWLLFLMLMDYEFMVLQLNVLIDLVMLQLIQYRWLLNRNNMY